MKRLPLVPVLAAVAGLAAPAGAAGAAAEDRCAKRASSTIESNAAVRVYEDRRWLFACLRRTGKHRFLARTYDDEYVASGGWSEVVLSETYVAWRYRSSDVSCKADCPPGYDGDSEWVEAIDMRTGSRRSAFYGGSLVVLALSRTGGLAYLTDAGVLWASDGGGDRVLATSGVDPRTVSMRGSLLGWRTEDGADGQALVEGGTTCRRRASVTRAWTDVGRVYDDGDGVLRSCRWTRNRHRRLTRAPHGHVEMAGRFVAWAEGDAVVVHDLLRGRRIRPAAGGLVVDVALGGDGAVAWLLSAGRLLATRGTVAAEIASGAIEAGSLAIRSGTLRWRQDGEPREAPVPE